MSQTIIEIMYYVGFIIIILSPAYTWWIFHGDDIKQRIFIKKHVIPFYDTLESEYGAKYPAVMSTPTSDAFEDFSPYKKNGLTFYFFVRDTSFVIVSETDPDFYIEIPFSDVLCYDCNYHRFSEFFQMEFYFMYNSKIEKLTFRTMEYNHKLDKKYGHRLTGEELFEFVRDTFMPEDEYKGIHGYASLSRY